MARVVCKGTTATWNSVAVIQIEAINYSRSMPMVEVTDLDSVAEEFVASMVKSNQPCTLECFQDFDNAAHAALVTDMDAGTSRTLLITFTGTAAVSGTAFVSNVNITARAKGVLRFTATFQYTGAVTLTPA